MIGAIYRTAIADGRGFVRKIVDVTEKDDGSKRTVIWTPLDTDTPGKLYFDSWERFQQWRIHSRQLESYDGEDTDTDTDLRTTLLEIRDRLLDEVDQINRLIRKCYAS